MEQMRNLAMISSVSIKADLQLKCSSLRLKFLQRDVSQESTVYIGHGEFDKNFSVHFEWYTYVTASNDGVA